MELKVGLRLSILLLVTPIVTGGVISASPSHAATFASSESKLDLDHFSQFPVDVRTLSDAKTLAIATDGFVNAGANAGANASFDLTSLFNGFSNFSWSQANGEGTDYVGLAQSFAAVIGYNFNIGSNQTFSFNFKGFLNLETFIDYPQYESANANGNISFQLFNATNGSLLDDFTISGNLGNLENSESFGYDKSTAITFTPSDISLQANFGGLKESASASVQGQYSRYFSDSISLTLVESKTNAVSVRAVPEPSSMLDFLFFSLIGVVFVFRLKLSQKQFASTHLGSAK